MIIIPFIVFLVTILSYLKKKDEWFLVGLLFFTTSGYLLVPASAFVGKPIDYISIITLFICFIERRNNSLFFSTRKDPIAKVIICILIWHVFSFINTILNNIEYPLYALKVERNNFIWLLYFYLRKIDTDSVKKSFKILLYISVFDGIFYYLQLIGITGIINGGADELFEGGEVARYRNVPPFYSTFILLAILSKSKGKLKYLIIVFFSGMLLMNQGRGTVLSLGIILITYSLLKNKAKNYISLIIIGSIAYLVLAPMFEYRAKQARSGKSTYEQIYDVISSGNIYNIDKEESSFAFRIAMLAERIQYFNKNPQYYMTGVGSIHEESPNCYHRFHFYIGTMNTQFYYGFCQIESGDITWVPLLIRYGIIGVIIYLMLLLCWMKKSFPSVKKSEDTLYCVFSIYSVSTIIFSFNYAALDNYASIINILLYLGYIHSYLINNKKNGKNISRNDIV